MIKIVQSIHTNKIEKLFLHLWRSYSQEHVDRYVHVDQTHHPAGIVIPLLSILSKKNPCEPSVSV